VPATRLKNVLLLLSLLRRQHPHPATARMIAEELYDSYDGRNHTDPTFLRELDRDLLPLRARGLVAPGREPRSYVLLMDQKPEADILTAQQHRALQQLWQDTEAPVARELPLPASAESDVGRIDRALGVLRILEEQQGGWIPLGRVP